MADTDQLISLLNAFGNNRATEVSDLNAFSQGISGSSPYRMAAAPLLSTRLNTSTWNPAIGLGAQTGNAFLGAFLNAFADRQESNQLAAVSRVLPQLNADPLGTATPEGVDEKAFAGLRANAIARASQNKGAQIDKLLGDLLTAKVNAIGEGEKEKAKILARRDAYDLDGKIDPDSPKEKKVSELRDYLDKSTEAENFKYVKRLSNQFVDVLKNPSAASDATVAKMVVQFVEPKLSTTAGETAALANSNSIPEALKGTIAQGLEGKSVYNAETKRKLIDLALASFKANKLAYMDRLASAKDEADLFDIPTSRIDYLSKPTKFDDVISKVDAENDMRSLAASLAQKGLSQQEIAATLRAKFGNK